MKETAKVEKVDHVKVTRLIKKIELYLSKKENKK